MSKKIRMLQTAKGSPNGYSVIFFESGKEYIVDDSLADAFVNQMKVATEVFAVFREEKAISEAPLNKSVTIPNIETNDIKLKGGKKRNVNNS